MTSSDAAGSVRNRLGMINISRSKATEPMGTLDPGQLTTLRTYVCTVHVSSSTYFKKNTHLQEPEELIAPPKSGPDVKDSAITALTSAV